MTSEQLLNLFHIVYYSFIRPPPKKKLYFPKTNFWLRPSYAGCLGPVESRIGLK